MTEDIHQVNMCTHIVCSFSIEDGKSKIQKVFGPKFHLSFPTKRRPEDKKCKAGTFPTDTDGRYKTKGVDLIIGAKQSVSSCCV